MKPIDALAKKFKKLATTASKKHKLPTVMSQDSPTLPQQFELRMNKERQ